MGLDVGGVEEHVGELDVVQAALPELAHSHVELGADAADLALGHPGVDAQGSHQVVDLAGRHAMHERLHDHRPQRPVDAAAGLEQGRKEAAVAELGDGQLDVTGLGRQQPGAAAVAMGGAGLVALVVGGADHLRRLQVNEGLQHELHRLPHEVEVSAGAQGVEKVGQGRLVEGHRGVLLRDPGKEHAEDPAVAPLGGGPSRDRPLRAPSRAEKISVGTRVPGASPQIPPLQGALTADLGDGGC